MAEKKDATKDSPQETHAESAAVIERAAEANAAKAVEEEAKEYEKAVEAAPTGEESDADLQIQSAGHTGTLKEWEDSPQGQAFIKARGGERQTEDDSKAKRRSSK